MSDVKSQFDQSCREVDCRRNVGDRVKLSLVNEIESDDLMHHLFHVRGTSFDVLPASAA